MITLLARFLSFGFILLLVGIPPAAAENLPVAWERYQQACLKTGGVPSTSFHSEGTGQAYCRWDRRREITECQVRASQVRSCTIRCSTDACYAANPDKSQPTWPLNGGPSAKRTLGPTPTLPPGQAAPSN